MRRRARARGASSTARHHIEWLRLLEVSGPFLSIPVLVRAFPQGLDARDAESAAEVRLAYEEWRTSLEGAHPNPALHREWLRWMLIGYLGHPAECLLEGPALPRGLEARIP